MSECGFRASSAGRRYVAPILANLLAVVGLLSVAPPADAAVTIVGSWTGEAIYTSPADGAVLDLVFVDAGAPNYQQLIHDLMKAQAAGRPIEVVVLESGRDGVEQITEAMAGRRDVSAVHIVSHGSEGNLTLGTGKLGAYNIENYRDAIKSWQASMTDDADLLIYGCDVAGSDQGREMVETLAALTGADVAASTDRTGNETLGGDWALEYEAGDIEAQIVFSSELRQSWDGLLAVKTFQQNTAGYTDTQDTWIKESDSSANFGASLVWRVDSVDTGGEDHGLIRFDNIFGGAAWQIPLGSTINSVTIDFQYTGNNGGQTVFWHRMLVDWNESTVTWDSMGGGVQTDGTDAVATPDASIAGPAGGAARGIGQPPAWRALCKRGPTGPRTTAGS